MIGPFTRREWRLILTNPIAIPAILGWCALALAIDATRWWQRRWS